MSNTPATDREESKQTQRYGCIMVKSDFARAFELAGAALYERLEHWIQMNSGVCDPKDLEAIDAWKEATK